MKKLSTEQISDFHTVSNFHICEKPLGDKIRVRDHSHSNRKYRGAAHQKCNLNYQDSKIIPVVFHNLIGYDAHLIIQDISNSFPEKLEALPETKEKYISFTKTVDNTGIKFRFIASFRFMASHHLIS